MAEVKILEPTPALYDYVLYYECASKDWKKGAKKTSIKGDGSLMELINWNSTYSYDPDDAGGKTLFGVTENAWKAYVKKHPNKNYSPNLNTMGRKGWMDVMYYYWNDYSYGSKSANYACAFSLFQMAWGGFSSTNLKKLLNTLKGNADIKNYAFKENGGIYEKIADATHAYNDPMIAYDYIRKANSTYLYNISTPDRSNKKYRCGWLTRNTLSFTPYGLFVPTGVSYQNANLKYESPLSKWEEVAIKWSTENISGYVKIMDWGASPESIEKISNSTYDSASESYDNNSSNGSSSNTYGGCGGVYQLGNYTNAPEMQIIYQQNQSREEILNTLISGSYTPNNVKPCVELISAEKKKNKKTKSES